MNPGERDWDKHCRATGAYRRERASSRVVSSASCFSTMSPFSRVQRGTPSRNTTLFFGLAATLSPGVIMPTRFRGSHADTTVILPLGSSLFTLRSASAASGKANCSPTNPETNLPPRISPLASSRRKTLTRSLQRGAIGSRASSSGNSTPYLFNSCLALGSTGSGWPPSASRRNHRPCTGRLCKARLGREVRRPRGCQLIRCRRACSVSAVTSPAETRDHRASSTSEGRRLVEPTRSDRKDAPRRDRRSITSADAPESEWTWPLDGSTSQGRDSLRARVIGVFLENVLLPLDDEPLEDGPLVS